MHYVMTAIGLVFLIIFLVEKVKRNTISTVVFKTITSVCFIMTALLSFLHTPELTNVVLIKVMFTAALIFGMLGDIALDFKYVYPFNDRSFTSIGFAAFFIGHLLFIFGMVATFGDGRKLGYVFLPIGIGILLGIAAGILGPFLKLQYGTLKHVVITYCSALFSMVLLAGSLALMNNFNVSFLNMVFIGGILFAISDVILSGTYFGEGHDRPINIISNGATYYAAQFIIALALSTL